MTNVSMEIIPLTIYTLMMLTVGFVGRILYERLVHPTRRVLSVVMPPEVPDVHLFRVFTAEPATFTAVEVVDKCGETYRLHNEILGGEAARQA